MEFHLLPIFTFLSLALVASHASLSPEAYWKSVLPNTPMPKAVRDILHPEWIEDKSTSVAVGKGGVNVAAGKGKPAGGGGGASGGTNVGVGKGGVSVNTGPKGKGKGKRVYVGVGKGPSPFLYNYAATEDQLHDNPNVALFFTEKDLSTVKRTMTLHFTKTTNAASFLPRQVAESIPFSSSKLPEILNHFSVKPDSMEAAIIKQTIKECEEPGIKGEDKYCATSLESMVDFSTTKLGKNVEALSTDVEKEETPMQEYSIVGVKKMGSEKSSVVCHKQNYAYAVFYCHKTDTTKAYLVSLVGADGTKAKAVAVCHTDTSAWNPKHLAFQVLKVKPGTVPVCHFLPEDHIVWVAN
uniref:Putative dehydration-responsive protein RD22 n=1 Tax=Davidia involucrata TaxID=16924 RepID=A0A5B7BKH7_DAVIN